MANKHLGIEAAGLSQPWLQRSGCESNHPFPELLFRSSCFSYAPVRHIGTILDWFVGEDTTNAIAAADYNMLHV